MAGLAIPSGGNAEVVLLARSHVIPRFCQPIAICSEAHRFTGLRIIASTR